jgi:hypothetical protein
LRLAHYGYVRPVQAKVIESSGAHGAADGYDGRRTAMAEVVTVGWSGVF